MAQNDETKGRSPCGGAQDPSSRYKCLLEHGLNVSAATSRALARIEGLHREASECGRKCGLPRWRQQSAARQGSECEKADPKQDERAWLRLASRKRHGRNRRERQTDTDS